MSSKSKNRPAPLPNGSLVGEYRILSEIASGGFGVVYLAQTALGERVAIKEYLPVGIVHREPGSHLPIIANEKQPHYQLGLKSFFEEGRALTQISHPSVVKVQNFFKQNETVYMVMDFVQGASLQEYIQTAQKARRSKVLFESTIVSLFNEILQGLRVVHQSKMLHLDLKPANILVTDDDRAVMIDFGAAREVLSQQGRIARPVYTPGFAAPEMYARDSALGPWTDIYSIGACIYASMRGKPPPDVPARQKEDEVEVELGKLDGVYSDGLIDLVSWCMDLHSISRPQSVLSLQKRLQMTQTLRQQDKPKRI
jgi:eukaryotic-like serine/threonine-protein kinase